MAHLNTSTCAVGLTPGRVYGLPNWSLSGCLLWIFVITPSLMGSQSMLGTRSWLGSRQHSSINISSGSCGWLSSRAANQKKNKSSFFSRFNSSTDILAQSVTQGPTHSRARVWWAGGRAKTCCPGCQMWPCRWANSLVLTGPKYESSPASLWACLETHRPAGTQTLDARWSPAKIFSQEQQIKLKIASTMTAGKCRPVELTWLGRLTSR